MVLKQKLTPELFLSAPRRGPAVPNRDGTLAFFSVSTHTFGGQGTTKKEVALLDLASGNTWTISEDDMVHDVNWLLGDESCPLLFLRTDERGETIIFVSSPPRPGDGRATGTGTTAFSISSSEYIAGAIPAPVRALKLRALDDGSIACAVIGLVGQDGGLFNEKAPGTASSSTVRIYDSWNVREWNTYIKPQKYSIWYSQLVRDDTAGGEWRLSSPFQNLLQDTDLESPDMIYEPLDPSDAFDIGQQGIAFVARDPAPAVPEATGCSDVYYAPLDTFAASTVPQPRGPRPVKIATQGPRRSPHGYSSNPRFSPDGTMLSYLKRPLECHADTRLMMGHVSSYSSFDVFDLIVGKPWHLRPAAFEYTPDGEGMYVLADDCGRVALYKLALRHAAVPRLVFPPCRGGGSSSPGGSVAGFHALRGEGGKAAGQLLVTSSSMTESTAFQIVDDGDGGGGGGGGGGHGSAAAATRGTPWEQQGEVGDEGVFEPRTVLAAATARFGISGSQVSEIYFEGAGDYFVQAWVVRPSNFDETRKYPLVLLIHGGPADASRDLWHMRWNPLVWAEQGYVVVLPNVTGSVGFGLEFTTRMFGEWGGSPYQDLVNCMAYLAEIPYLDLDRAIAAGASYGGYMINWIIGHSLARKFKALFCQSGLFNLPQLMQTQDMTGDTGEFRGPPFPWTNHAELNKWNPARPDLLSNWARAPPTLIIHGEKDYRAPVTEGLAAFRTLRLMGRASRFVTFPDECHWVEKPENALEWHRLVFEWFGKYTRDCHTGGVREGDDHGHGGSDGTDVEQFYLSDGSLNG